MSFFSIQDNRFLLWLGVSLIALGQVRSLADLIRAVGVSMITYAVIMFWTQYRRSVKKRQWNNGICAQTGEKWEPIGELFRAYGFRSEKNGVEYRLWVKYYELFEDTKKKG